MEEIKMAYDSYTTTCDCGARVCVEDHAMGVPGGKEPEEGYCPHCRAVVAHFMTDGVIRVYLVSAPAK